MTGAADDVDSAKNLDGSKIEPLPKKIDGPKAKSRAQAKHLESHDTETSDFPETEMHRFPTRNASINAIAVDRMQSLQWESNKLTKVIWVESKIIETIVFYVVFLSSRSFRP